MSIRGGGSGGCRSWWRGRGRRGRGGRCGRGCIGLYVSGGLFGRGGVVCWEGSCWLGWWLGLSVYLARCWGGTYPWWKCMGLGLRNFLFISPWQQRMGDWTWVFFLEKHPLLMLEGQSG